MSKGNLFLGFGRGSVGDVVFSHVDGEQVARARNRSPRNPKTALQLLQRVCLKTTSSAYSLMQDICNHSFQGFAEGTQSQAQFNKINIGKFREQLAIEINSGDESVILESTETNFAAKTASLVEINPYTVSDGSLTKLPIKFYGSAGSPAFGIALPLPSAAPTYQEVLTAYGLQRGDQLTFLSLSVDDTQEVGQFNGFDYARVILDPDNAVMTSPFLSGSAINSPNERNRGGFSFYIVQDSTQYFLTWVCNKHAAASGLANSAAAGTAIVSRLAGGVWQRSPQALVLRSWIISQPGHLQSDHDIDYLSDAILSYMTSDSSTLYLNQAGVTGPEVASALLASVTLGANTVARGANANGESPMAVSATMTNAAAGVSYKLAVYTSSGTSVGTKVVDTAFSDMSASIASRSWTNGEYVVCLTDGTNVLDQYCRFVVDGD